MYKCRIILGSLFFLSVHLSGSTWSKITTSIDSFVTCSTIDTSNNRLYFSSTTLDDAFLPLTIIKYWDGDTCLKINHQIHGRVNAMMIYNGNLIIGGKFKSIDNLTVINLAAISDEGNVIQIGDLDSTYNCTVNSMAIFNSLLYIGGYFNDLNTIAKWNGTKFSFVSESPNNSVMAMYVYNNILYVGGIFDKVNNIKCENIAKWNGSTWDTVINGLQGRILSITSYNDDLLVGGLFFTTDTVDLMFSIARLNNNEWTSLDTGIYSAVTSMTEYNGELFVGGVIERAGSINVKNIAKWNGSEWNNCGQGITKEFRGAFITSLIVFNDELFIFGRFDTANQITCNNIIKYHY